MRDCRWVCGQVAEVQRFIDVSRRWCKQHSARERRELWITADQGPEFKFVVHTTLMSARRGHRVLALVMGRELAALHNLQPGESVAERGYVGASSHFRFLLAGMHPRPIAEAYLRPRTLPAEQAQVDWGHFGH